MHSSDPKIEPLLVQVNFSDVAKLIQVKVDCALVTALIER